MTDPELYWAAGFFDGEGSCVFVKNGKYRHLAVCVTQADLEPLERFRSAVGIGRLHGPYHRANKNVLPQYSYQISAREDCLAFIEKIRPYLCSIKKAQMDDALNKFMEYEESFVPVDRSESSARGWVTRRKKIKLAASREVV